jgi:hypothetical protein
VRKGRRIGTNPSAPIRRPEPSAPEQTLGRVGDLIVVLEAMKMENPVNAHKAGVTGLVVAVTQGTILAEIT